MQVNANDSNDLNLPMCLSRK